MYRVICFDLWNTLIRSLGTGASYEQVLVERGVPTEQIFPFVRDRLMTRKMSYIEMARSLFANFALELTSGEMEKLTGLWTADNTQAVWISGALEMVRALRAQGRIVVLVTNSTAPGWKEVNRRFHMESEFDYIYVSCETGCVKPDSKVWDTIESRFPVVARGEFAMVGDREADDLAIPRARGWGAIHANEMESVASKCGPRPTTLVVDTDHLVDVAQLQVLGINPLSTDTLTTTLAKWGGWRTLNPETTVIVVPGNGGSIIAHELLGRLPEPWPLRVVPIAAKRIWSPGAEPWAATSPIFHGRMMLGVKDIVLIDNVVASGCTVRKIYELNQPWIPGARWHTLTWLAQSSASMPGEMNLVAAALCGNRARREPIATMSTLLSDDEVLTSFAERNFPNNSKEVIQIFRSFR